MNDVQMMSGWTMEVIFFGNLAPKVKVVRVVKSMSNAWMGVLTVADTVDDGYDVSIVATADRIVPVDKKLNVRSENALGGAVVVVVVVVTVAATGCSGSDDGNSFRTPMTEYAVENNVKKNPTIMTAATFKTLKML